MSANVTVLTEGVLKTMLPTKLRVGTAVLLPVAVAGLGVALLHCWDTAAALAGDKPLPKVAEAQTDGAGARKRAINTEEKQEDRKLTKQPVYKTKDPRYCKLVFGPEAKRIVWMVIDGEDLYLDKNGNGDLTDDGERVVRKPWWLPLGGGFEISDLSSRGEKDKYTSMIVFWTPADVRTHPKDYPVEVMMEVNKKFGQYGVFKATARSPKDAPVLHFGGPLELRLPAGFSLPAKGEAGELAAVIGTRSSTGHGVMVRHDRGLPPEANIHPLAEISFPAKTVDGGLIRMMLALDQRCCNVRFYAPVQVPIAVSDRQARITLSFPDWKEGKVAPSTVEVPIGEPTIERKDGKK